MIFTRKPLLIAIIGATFLLSTSCSKDSLSTGELGKIALLGGGVVAGALVGGAISENKGMGTVVGGAAGLGLGAAILAATGKLKF